MGYMQHIRCKQQATSKFVIKTATTPQEDHIVNLDAKKRSCSFFYGMQRPCAHAPSLSDSEEWEGHKGILSSHLLCFVESLRSLYAGNFRLVSPTLSVLVLDDTGVPLTRRMPGRPKKPRHRNRLELASEICQSVVVDARHNGRTFERRARGERVERQQLTRQPLF
jgi:hypothetical protein